MKSGFSFFAEVGAYDSPAAVDIRCFALISFLTFQFILDSNNCEVHVRSLLNLLDTN
jgi:hypothetical protein